MLLTSAHHAASHNPNIVTTTQRLPNVANPSTVSNLRLLSQLIPLHPKVIHMSHVLFPWKDFFWTDDSPLQSPNKMSAANANMVWPEPMQNCSTT